MSKKIKIKSAPGQQPSWTEGNDLVGLYFEETSTPGQFLLYAPSNAQPPGPGTVITTNPTPLTSGTNFSFTWDSLYWSITNFAISITAPPNPVGTASGSWSATTPQAHDTMPSEEGGDPESGSFQANDTVDEVEGESSVSANA